MNHSLKGFPRTLSTIAPGWALDASEVFPGLYIWHKGAYRLVTAVEQVGAMSRRIRMGRFSITTWRSVEVAPC